jgi:hypothetical protein
MGTLLVILLSCGPPRDDSDCRLRCDACEPSCVNTRGSLGATPDEECAPECDIDSVFCWVDDGECVLASG